jgi:hypothetical protein
MEWNYQGILWRLLGLSAAALIASTAIRWEIVQIDAAMACLLAASGSLPRPQNQYRYAH